MTIVTRETPLYEIFIPQPGERLNARCLNSITRYSDVTKFGQFLDIYVDDPSRFLQEPFYHIGEKCLEAMHNKLIDIYNGTSYEIIDDELKQQIFEALQNDKRRKEEKELKLRRERHNSRAKRVIDLIFKLYGKPNDLHPMWMDLDALATQGGIETTPILHELYLELAAEVKSRELEAN